MLSAEFVKLVGDRRLTNKLKRLELKTQKKFARRATRAAAKVIATEARARAPQRTGRLAKSIKVRAAKLGRKGFGHQVRTGAASELGIPSVLTGNPGYYPAHLELGAKNQPAMPYLRPAVEARRRAAIQAMRNSLRADIKGEARRG